MTSKMTRIDGVTTRPKVYLAGPDVFLEDSAPVNRNKKQILDAFGLDGYVPTDNEIALSKDNNSGNAIATAIARANFEMMGWCDSCIAQLTPFRGPSADVGTVGETAVTGGGPLLRRTATLYRSRRRPFGTTDRSSPWRYRPTPIGSMSPAISWAATT